MSKRYHVQNVHEWKMELIWNFCLKKENLDSGVLKSRNDCIVWNYTLKPLISFCDLAIYFYATSHIQYLQCAENSIVFNL